MTTKETKKSDDISTEISLLEKGHEIDKLISDKLKFTKRTFKIDLKNSRLVANSRQFGKKERSCK